MSMKTLIPLTLVLALVGAACGDDDTTTTTMPDDRAAVFVDSVEFTFLESYPVQVRATVSGNLPTPCHELKWELETSDGADPILTMWSIVDPEAVCAQVLEPFEEIVDVGSFENGSYSLEVNGESYPFEI